jgi:hypothetical protein
MDQGANYETDEEYIEAFNNLVGYFDVLIQMDQEQKKKQELGESDTSKLLLR